MAQKAEEIMGNLWKVGAAPRQAWQHSCPSRRPDSPSPRAVACPLASALPT